MQDGASITCATVYARGLNALALIASTSIRHVHNCWGTMQALVLGCAVMQVRSRREVRLAPFAGGVYCWLVDSGCTLCELASWSGIPILIRLINFSRATSQVTTYTNRVSWRLGVASYGACRFRNSTFPPSLTAGHCDLRDHIHVFRIARDSAPLLLD